jgi:hypothetical protein
MTPAEVRGLTASEYLAFLRHMDEDARAQKKAAQKKGKR